MQSRSAEDIIGIEFDWLASDANGYIALFSTAGHGYAPAAFLKDTDAHDRAIDAILASPVVTKARVAPRLSAERPNVWLMMAERGLFAYDADSRRDIYRLVAVPDVPVSVVDLPRPLAVVPLLFSELKFGELLEISPTLLHA